MNKIIVLLLTLLIPFLSAHTEEQRGVYRRNLFIVGALTLGGSVASYKAMRREYRTASNWESNPTRIGYYANGQFYGISQYDKAAQSRRKAKQHKQIANTLAVVGISLIVGGLVIHTDGENTKAVKQWKF